MNKMFTAVAILQLAQNGKLDLKAPPIGKNLTDYPNKDVASKVTIEQLLSHTGGTGDIFGPRLLFARPSRLKKREAAGLKAWRAILVGLI